MLASKKLTDFTNTFSPHDFKKSDGIILSYFNIYIYIYIYIYDIILSNSIETIDRTNLTEQTKIRRYKITEMEHYFHKEINQKKSCCKNHAFDYIDKVLSFLRATSGGVSIISFTSVAGAPVGKASAGFTLIFYLTTGMIKKLLSITRNKKKSTIKFLCWIKVSLIISKP